MELGIDDVRIKFDPPPCARGCNPPDDSDIVQFVDRYTFSEPDEAWWKDHLDLPEYFSYRAVVDVARDDAFGGQGRGGCRRQRHAQGVH